MLDEREAVDRLYEAEINGMFAEKVGFLTHHLGILLLKAGLEKLRIIMST